MALRTVRVFVHNETTSSLSLTDARCDWGDWGADGTQRPPQTIPGNATVMMRTESTGGLIPQGTEAHVWYRIGSDSTATLALHWNNPVSGGNTYHQSTDRNHFAFRVGGSGNDAVVHFYLRRAEPRNTGFLPSRDGFRFPNQWPQTPYSLPPLRGSVLDLKYGNAANGLCGGMVFAARDYFEAGLSIPDTEVPPLGEQDPLFTYLVDRLFDSFGGLNVSLMLKLMNPLYPDTDESLLGPLGLAAGRASVMVHEEWPLIRSDIDAGHPSPVALITVKSALPWDLGKCHQVLAYGYEVHGDDVLIRVYDPNQELDDRVHLRFSTRTVAERIVVEHNVAVTDDDRVSRRPIYCFIRLRHTPRVPTVLTPPRPARPPVEVPRQVSLRVTDTEVLASTIVGSDRRLFDILPVCGQREFDFTVVAQQQRITVAVHAVSYVKPQVTWMLNDAAVPAGRRQTVRPHPSEPGHAYTEQDATGSHSAPPVTLTTTTDGLRLFVENVAGDGQYGITARASVTEQDGSEARSTSIAFTVLGTREIVPGLAEATNRCFAEWLDSLREEGPTEEAIAAAAYAQLGRPPDPLWDPDPLQLITDWQDGLLDPDAALVLDPAEQVPDDRVVELEWLGPDRIVIDRDTEVVIVDRVVDDANGRDKGGVTVVNGTAQEVVVVDRTSHEAIAVIPPDEEMLLASEGTFDN